MEQKQQISRATTEVAVKNKRLAIFLALIALGFYFGFILMQMK